jgi:penicillin G amidase
MPPRRAGRLLARTAVVVLIATALTALWLRHTVRASLPRLDGEQRLVGLQAAVTVSRDALGMPTIEAASRLDVARALGFLHAQERLFQMDLLRRRAAGELAELVGAAALPMDRAVRVHRLRGRARAFVKAGREEERLVLEAYAAGVNSGRLALDLPPFEYLLLREQPAPWQPEDSLLVAYAMFLDLHDENGRRESDLGLMHDLLPPALFAFLAPAGTEWDAPVVGSPYPEAPLPGPDVLDLRSAAASGPAPAPPERADADGPVAWLHEPSVLAAQDVGSNNWVVAGAHTSDGRALLANDMHLAIGVPNIWYRASFSWPDGQNGERHRLTGVTLPGVPSMVVGTNTRIAWGFTNSQGDWTDLVELDVQPGDPGPYRTPAGPRAFETLEERIRVKGGAEEILRVRETIWGPVVDEDHAKRPRAVAWTAHSVDAVNVGLLGIETARSLDEALEQAAVTGVPPQNFVCAEASGRIGWTIAGRIPRRVGFDGRLPGSWATGERRWDGWLAPDEYPRIVDPPRGRIWTANARVVEGEMVHKIGDGGFALGARARQIRDDLLALPRATERDMLRVQLDDRAVFLSSWRDLLLRTLAAAQPATDSRRAELRAFVESWGGRAAVDSVGYRAVRAFRIQVAQQVLSPLVAACTKADKRFDYLASVWQYEAPLWRLVSERPAHLLDPRFTSWDAALLAAADAVIADLTRDGQRLAQRTWGERNTARIQHPLSRALPLLGRWLDMPRDPLPGDGNMPRVGSPTHGASERLVVSPGHEKDGLFHMPGGQSGHPLSDYYAKGHSAWVKGEATPFLPGAPAHTLTLRP